ncbi:MAG TPA: carbohydrate kinase [Candidatus Aminicenantes bacterium]|nr:carbohydrate kinase [Candidatus Aminicenantes bacterium]
MKDRKLFNSQSPEERRSSQNRFVLVGIGEILWDMLPEGPRLGGAPANFAYYAQALGEKGIIVSRIGADEAGEKIITQLRFHGLESKYISIEDKHPTGKVTVNLDSQGKPQFEIHRDCAWDYLEITPELRELATQADAVCYGSLAQRAPVARQSIREFISHTRSDCLRIFDVNLRPPFYALEDINWLLKRSQVLKLNDEELRILAELFQIDNQERLITEFFFSTYPIELMVLTRGERGSSLYTRERTSNFSALPVRVVDTVGAGDAFTAAVAVGLLHQEDLDKINETANRLAAYVCTQPGAWAPLSGEWRYQD